MSDMMDEISFAKTQLELETRDLVKAFEDEWRPLVIDHIWVNRTMIEQHGGEVEKLTVSTRVVMR